MPRKVTHRDGSLTLAQLTQFFSQTIEPRFDALEGNIAGTRRDIADIKAGQVDLYKKIEDLQIEYTIIKEQLHRIEKRLGLIEGRLDRVEGRLGSLETRMDMDQKERKLREEELPRLKEQLQFLQKRIEQLENRP